MWKEVESHIETKEEKEINSLLVEAPMHPPPVKQGAPHLNPTVQSMHVLLFLSFRSKYLLISRFTCLEKKGETQECYVQQGYVEKKERYICVCMN